MFDFLVQFRLTDLVQDIVVGQFDSNAFIKAYIVGVSVSKVLSGLWFY